MRRRGIKGKWKGGGGTIGWGFQVMLIPLIYLISGWRWALFTSDVPLLGKTDEREGSREREWRMSENERLSENRTRETENSRVVSGAGWWDGWSEV